MMLEQASQLFPLLCPSPPHKVEGQLRGIQGEGQGAAARLPHPVRRQAHGTVQHRPHLQAQAGVHAAPGGGQGAYKRAAGKHACMSGSHRQGWGAGRQQHTVSGLSGASQLFSASRAGLRWDSPGQRASWEDSRKAS